MSRMFGPAPRPLKGKSREECNTLAARVLRIPIRTLLRKTPMTTPDIALAIQAHPENVTDALGLMYYDREIEKRAGETKNDRPLLFLKKTHRSRIRS